MVTRRDTLRLIAAHAAAPLLSAGAAGWTPDWDKALLDAALGSFDAQFDAGEGMLRRKIGPAYNYHSTLRNTTAHPIRESLEYALLLFEARQDERAQAILNVVLTLQDTQASSQWYGIWGYYAEEPPSKMSSADWNWADFNGATLLMIAFRHGDRLSPSLRARTSESIRHAAASIRKRNVAMSDTSIAVEGTFVSIGAAQLLNDAELRGYGTDRLNRLSAAIDEWGSFAEYNSPTWARVTIASLTRMRMMIKDPGVLDLASRIHQRAWLQLARHWHAPTRQLAGPQSRCSSTDIGQPVWLQKSLGGKIEFVGLDRLATVVSEGNVAVLDYTCPADLQSQFIETPPARTHREVFFATDDGKPVAGATYLDPRYSVGSANRSEFWAERRPLLAYWGGVSRPARYAQLRVMKDSYDFSSALLYSVQEKGYVLGVVNFRAPGGDRHVLLDPIRDGQFDASRLRLRLDLANLAEDSKILSNGKPVFGNLEAKNRMSFDLDGPWLHFQIRGWSFGDGTPKLSLGLEEGMMVLSFDLIGGARRIRWSEMAEAWVAFTFCISEGREDRTTGFDAARADGRIHLEWKTPAGALALSAAMRPGPVDQQDAAFEEFLNGAPIKWPRLSDERLVKRI
jgi:hypothetical protein